MFRILSLYILLIGLPLCCYALPEDNDKKMRIAANSTSFDYKTGTNTYEGDVKIDQGSTHVLADRMVTQNNDHHKMEEVIAYGIEKLAEYNTITKLGDPEFHAKAKTIKFYPIKATVILEGSVIVTQGENSFQGPIIIYNIKDQTVTAPASQNGRATLVIDAKQLKL